MIETLVPVCVCVACAGPKKGRVGWAPFCPVVVRSDIFTVVCGLI